MRSGDEEGNGEKGRGDLVEWLERGSVMYESNDRPCRPLDEDEIMVK